MNNKTITDISEYEKSICAILFHRELNKHYFNDIFRLLTEEFFSVKEFRQIFYAYKLEYLYGEDAAKDAFEVIFNDALKYNEIFHDILSSYNVTGLATAYTARK